MHVFIETDDHRFVGKNQAIEIDIMTPCDAAEDVHSWQHL